MISLMYCDILFYPDVHSEVVIQWKGFKILNHIESWGAVQGFKVLDLTSFKILEYLICGFRMTAFKEVTSLVAYNSEFYYLYMGYISCDHEPKYKNTADLCIKYHFAEFLIRLK